MLYLLFLLPVFNVHFIIDLILVLIINMIWLIGLVILKDWMLYQEFDITQHVLQLYYNLLSRNLRNTTFNVILILNLFVFWNTLRYFQQLFYLLISILVRQLLDERCY